MNQISKYFNFKILTVTLVIVLSLSAIFSSSLKNSFYYGDVVGYNVLFYTFLVLLLYINRNYLSKYQVKLRRLILILPTILIILGSLLLFSSASSQYIDWLYIFNVGILSFVSLLFAIIYIFKKRIFKVLGAILMVLSMGAFLMGEIAYHLPSPILEKVTYKIYAFYKVTNNNIKPDFSTTLAFVRATFWENKLLGEGPNQYYYIWQKHRPASLSVTNYYNMNPDNSDTAFAKILLESGVAAILVIMIGVMRMYLLLRERHLLTPNEAKVNTLHSLLIGVSMLMILLVTNNFLFLIHYILLVYLPSSKVDTVNTSKLKKAFVFIIFAIIVILLILKSISYKMVDKVALSINTDANKEMLISRLDIANMLFPNNFVNSFKAKIYLSEAMKMVASTSKDKRDAQWTDVYKALIDKAIRYATLSVEGNKTNAYVYDERAQIYEVATLIDEKIYIEKAKEDYNKAILLDPNNPDHMLALSRLQYLTGSKVEAANLVDRMLTLKPNYTPAYLSLADMLEAENKREVKAYVLQEALKADRTNQNVAYMLAQEYYKLGLYDDYQKLMQDLIALNPNLDTLKQQLDQAMKEAKAKSNDDKDKDSDKESKDAAAKKKNKDN